MSSMDTVKDALCAMTAEPAEDVNFFSFLDNTVAPHYLALDASTTPTDQVTWATDYGHDQGQAMQPRSFQFGAENNNHLFDFALTPTLDTQWCYPADDSAGRDGANCSSVHAPGSSSESISGGLPDDGHQTLSASLDPFASLDFFAPSSSLDSSSSWDSATPLFSFDGLETSLYSGSVSSMPSKNGHSNETGVEAEQSTTAMECNSNTEVSWGERAVFEPDIVSHHCHQRGSTQLRSAQTGWTYRQVLEIAAFPPPDAPHLWRARVSQLAAKLGMPSGSTGRDIVTFVIHVATVKNDLAKVDPLVKAIAAAARILEGRTVVSSELQSLVVNLYPGVARAYGIIKTDLDAGINTPLRGYCDQISLAAGEVQPSSVPPRSETERGGEATGGEDGDEPAPKRPRSRVAERDLYCRVGACLASFKDPSTCIKHRQRHFPLAWRCPGPCQTRSANRGRFARDETLKRHLLFPRYASCKDAVLRTLGLESIPAFGRGTAWMAPLRDGPERPWERPGFQLTDLETVQARLRDPNFVASPLAAPTIGRRRYK